MKTIPTGRFISARTLALLVSSTLAPAALANNCAIVFGGGGPGQPNIQRITANARDQYLAKGYTTLRVTNCTKAQILAALNNPCVTHILFAGHGTWNRNTSQWQAKIWIGPGTGPDDYLSAAEVVAAIPAGRRGAMQQVVFQACGQLRQEWADAFPNAVIQGWSFSVPCKTAEWDQWAFGANRITPKGSRGGILGEETPIDPRIQAAIPMVEHPGTDDSVAEAWADLAQFLWVMPPSLASAFGDRKFNLIVGNSPADEIVLGGIQVVNGDVVLHQPDPFPDADFDLRMSHAAYETAVMNTDSIPDSFMLGEAYIGANSTGVPDTTLAMGAVAVTFGHGALTPPLCFGDADGSGSIDFTDITTTLVHWGESGPPFTPGDSDGSGSVDFTDITTTLVHWAETCPE